MTITINDESAVGKILNQITLEVEAETMTAEDFIRLRVENEVEKYNNGSDEYYNGLVSPTDAERTLNGFKTRDKKEIDAEKQVYIALKAFQQNGFFMLVDERQVERLHDPIRIGDDTKVSFVRLTPLIGG